MAKRKEQAAPRCVILDSGAVIAWSRGDAGARAMLTRALELGVDVRIPVAVLAETLRGGPRDAPIHRVRSAVDVFPAQESIARVAGALLGRTRGKNTVDALVAAEAIASDADVFTSDAADLEALLANAPNVSVVRI
jgi:predicted nucleic acid-binding protein